MLCHLVIAPVPNSITLNITLQKKRAFSDWSITHLIFAHGWIVMKASTCSKPYAPLSMRLQHVVFTSWFAYKKGKISKYNYTSCNHSSVKEQQRLLSISLTHMCEQCGPHMCYVQTGCSWQFKISANYVKPLSPNSSLVFIIHLMYQRFKVLLLGTTSVLWIMDNY